MRAYVLVLFVLTFYLYHLSLLINIFLPYFYDAREAHYNRFGPHAWFDLNIKYIYLSTGGGCTGGGGFLCENMRPAGDRHLLCFGVKSVSFSDIVLF